MRCARCLCESVHFAVRERVVAKAHEHTHIPRRSAAVHLGPDAPADGIKGKRSQSAQAPNMFANCLLSQHMSYSGLSLTHTEAGSDHAHANRTFTISWHLTKNRCFRANDRVFVLHTHVPARPRCRAPCSSCSAHACACVCVSVGVRVRVPVCVCIRA